MKTRNTDGKPAHDTTGRVAAKRPVPRGWHSTDEDEVERRRMRATTEPIAIRPIQRQGCYGDFLAGGDATGQGAYRVEIRTLDRPENTCGCMDFRKNDRRHY